MLSLDSVSFSHMEELFLDVGLALLSGSVERLGLARGSLDIASCDMVYNVELTDYRIMRRPRPFSFPQISAWP